MQKKSFTCLPVFAPLLQPARYKGAFGGRGSGKSHFFASLVVASCLRQPGTRVVCIREVQKNLNDSAKLLIEDQIVRHGVESRFSALSDQIRTPGGGKVIFRGMSDYNADGIKSLEGFHIAWCEEAHTLSRRSLELLRPTMRMAGSELWFSWNPQQATDPVDEFLRGLSPPPDAIVVQANYQDNPFFPSVLEDERQFDKITQPARYGHIWLGQYEPAVAGAIWDRGSIHSNRVHVVPDMGRILIGVDHAVTDSDVSDEHGIVAAGLGGDGRGYLLEDASRRGSPKDWATTAVALYDKYNADAVVIERNQGGDLVRHTLHSIRPGLPIIEVVATRGKHVRAEPIAALYALGKISHVGDFPDLEGQLCKFTSSGYTGSGSPDRAEAAIWAFTKLFPAMIKPVQVNHEPDLYTAARDWSL